MHVLMFNLALIQHSEPAVAVAADPWTNGS